MATRGRGIGCGWQGKAGIRESGLGIRKRMPVQRRAGVRSESTSPAEVVLHRTGKRRAEPAIVAASRHAGSRRQEAAIHVGKALRCAGNRRVGPQIHAVAALRHAGNRRAAAMLYVSPARRKPANRRPSLATRAPTGLQGRSDASVHALLRRRAAMHTVTPTRSLRQAAARRRTASSQRRSLPLPSRAQKTAHSRAKDSAPRKSHAANPTRQIPHSKTGGPKSRPSASFRLRSRYRPRRGLSRAVPASLPPHAPLRRYARRSARPGR